MAHPLEKLCFLPHWQPLPFLQLSSSAAYIAVFFCFCFGVSDWFYAQNQDVWTIRKIEKKAHPATLMEDYEHFPYPEDTLTIIIHAASA